MYQYSKRDSLFVFIINYIETETKIQNIKTIEGKQARSSLASGLQKRAWSSQVRSSQSSPASRGKSIQVKSSQVSSSELG